MVNILIIILIILLILVVKEGLGNYLSRNSVINLRYYLVKEA